MSLIHTSSPKLETTPGKVWARPGQPWLATKTTIIGLQGCGRGANHGNCANVHRVVENTCGQSTCVVIRHKDAQTLSLSMALSACVATHTHHAYRLGSRDRDMAASAPRHHRFHHGEASTSGFHLHRRESMAMTTTVAWQHRRRWQACYKTVRHSTSQSLRSASQEQPRLWRWQQ